jgi:hypothetical protein
MSALVESGLCADQYEMEPARDHAVEEMRGCYTSSPRERVQVLQYRSSDQMSEWWNEQLSSVAGEVDLFAGNRVIVLEGRTMVLIGQSGDFSSAWIEQAQVATGGELRKLIDIAGL